MASVTERRFDVPVPVGYIQSNFGVMDVNRSTSFPLPKPHRSRTIKNNGQPVPAVTLVVRLNRKSRFEQARERQSTQGQVNLDNLSELASNRCHDLYCSLEEAPLMLRIFDSFRNIYPVREHIGNLHLYPCKNLWFRKGITLGIQFPLKGVGEFLSPTPFPSLFSSKTEPSYISPPMLGSPAGIGLIFL